MIALDRTRTATHVAGHLAMAAALSVPIGMASIRYSEPDGRGVDSSVSPFPET